MKKKTRTRLIFSAQNPGESSMNYLEKAYQKGLKARESQTLPGGLGGVVKGIGALWALLDMLFSREKGPREKGHRTVVRRKKR